MGGSNAGTGWPLTLRCAKCKAGRDWRNDPHGGTYLLRTGRTKPYRGGNKGARGLLTFYEYACITCGHVGWTRHKDVLTKSLAHYVEIVSASRRRAPNGRPATDAASSRQRSTEP